jgi:23S rRNA pseudouridine1911/1915/1917 synthase
MQSKDYLSEKPEKKRLEAADADNKRYTDLEILFEDNHIVVAIKPQNIPSQEDISGDKDMLTMLKEFLIKKYNKPGAAFVGLVHRLDRPTGGVMVFAKTSKAAARLSEGIKDGDFEKRYLAVLCGRPSEPQGKLVHYLKKNSVTNTVYIATSGTTDAKRAELDYKTLEFISPITLCSINLLTGRSHQIRLQMSTLSTPVFGDAKYGGDKYAKGHNLALWATELRFTHPVTARRMVFLSYPPESAEPWKRFDLDKHLNIF